MGLIHNIPYNKIIDQFRQACRQNVEIATFETGTIDFLDANAVNKNYPYIYLRPLPSQGVVEGVKGNTFELFSMDVPKLSDESPVDILAQCEERIYALLSWFNKGDVQQTYEVTITDLSPVNEAFQDRVYGWVATIDVLTPYRWDYCDYPFANTQWLKIQGLRLGLGSGSNQDIFCGDVSQDYFVRVEPGISFPDNIQNKTLYVSQSFTYPYEVTTIPENNFISYTSASGQAHADFSGNYVKLKDNTIGIDGKTPINPSEIVYGLINTFDSGSDETGLACSASYLDMCSGSTATAVYVETEPGNYNFPDNVVNRPLRLVDSQGEYWNPTFNITSSYVGMHFTQCEPVTCSIADFTGRIYISESKAHLDTLTPCSSNGPDPIIFTLTASFDDVNTITFNGDIQQRGTGSYIEDGFFYSFGEPSFKNSASLATLASGLYTKDIDAGAEGGTLYYQAFMKTQRGDTYTGIIRSLEIPGIQDFTFMGDPDEFKDTPDNACQFAQDEFENMNKVKVYARRLNNTQPFPQNIIRRQVYTDPGITTPLLREYFPSVRPFTTVFQDDVETFPVYTVKLNESNGPDTITIDPNEFSVCPGLIPQPVQEGWVTFIAKPIQAYYQSSSFVGSCNNEKGDFTYYYAQVGTGSYSNVFCALTQSQALPNPDRYVYTYPDSSPQFRVSIESAVQPEKYLYIDGPQDPISDDWSHQWRITQTGSYWQYNEIYRCNNAPTDETECGS